MERITSTNNQKIKEWRKLHTAKGRKQAGLYMIEGEHLYIEAFNHHVKMEATIVTDHFLEKNSHIEATVIVSESVMQSLSQTETAPGIIAILPIEEPTMPSQLNGKYILLDAVQDPGNAGTIVRTADAAGFDGVVFGTGSVDAFNDKVVRSMQGSQFHVPIYRLDLASLISSFKEAGTPVYGTALDERAKRHKEIPLTDSVAIIMGNEGKGVSKTVLAQTDANVYIPIVGKAESLNVSVAASILMYHFVN